MSHRPPRRPPYEALLARILAAQDRDATWDRALAELEDGWKSTCWMWYVFPGPALASSSARAQRYAVQTPAAAAAHLAHPVLGPRYRAARAAALTAIGRGVPPYELFGTLDEPKFYASLRVHHLAEVQPPFHPAPPGLA